MRVASGGDKTNSVEMAIKGLQTNIQEVIKEVRAENLKNKFRNTVKVSKYWFYLLILYVDHNGYSQGYFCLEKKKQPLKNEFCK